MKKLTGSESAPIPAAAVLSLSPIVEDHVTLERIFHESAWAVYTNCRWTLHRRATLSSALQLLRQEPIPIVICECNLLPGTWRDMLDRIVRLPNPPFLIVTSRLADSRLWAEALNLGAYDVLAKPFDRDEVVRIVSLAWLHWKDQSATSAKTPRMETLRQMQLQPAAAPAA